MKKETDKLTFSNVIEELKISKYFFSPQLLYFSLFVILSLLIAYVLPSSLIITVPFVIVPSYFAFSATNSIKARKSSGGVGFFTMYKAYFTTIFFGGYRLIAGFFKALGIYILSNFTFVTILAYTVFRKIPEYQNLVNVIQESGDVSSISEAVENCSNVLNSNETLQKWIFLATVVSTLIGAITFIHHIMVQSLKMRRNIFVKQLIPVKQFNFVDKRVRKDNRGFLFGSYTRTCWFIQLLMVLTGVGGVALSYFFLKDLDVQNAVVISLFLMFLVALPFMNYISKVQDLLYFSLAEKYEETFATLTLEFLAKYKEKIGIAEEDAKKLEEFLKMSQDQSKNKEEDKKEDDEVK